MRSLVIEDDPGTRLVLCRYLEAAGPTASAEDGASGTRLFTGALDAGEPFDLVCLDVILPDVSGTDALASLRREENARRGAAEGERAFGAPPAVIVMLTSLDDPLCVVSCFNNGCEGYLTKPFSRDLMDKELRRLGFVVPPVRGAGAPPGVQIKPRPLA